MKHVGLLMIVVSGCVVGGGDDGGDVTNIEATSVDHVMQRVTIGRMFIQGVPVLEDLNPGLPATRSTVAHDALAAEYGRRVADKLQRLSPDLTYISGLLRINDPSYQLTPDEITAYRTVRQAFPNAKLDVTLSTKHGPSNFNDADSLEALMRRVDGQISPGLWFFDFFNEGGKESNGSWSIHAVIDWVHKNQPNKLIGGNYFNRVPEDANGTGDADFFAVADNKDFDLDQKRIDDLHAKFHKPVLMHIGNNPQDEPLANDGRPLCVVNNTRCQEAACRFLYNFSWQEKHDYVVKRIDEHADRNYHYMYNVFFPACPLTHYFEAQNAKNSEGLSILQVMHDHMN